MQDTDPIAKYLTEYSPEIAAQLQSGRKHLAAHFPQGFELVYNTYNALGFGFAHGNRASDVVVSIVGYPRWVTLFFLHGAGLPDPEGILEGKGSRVRSVRLDPFTKLESPAVQMLIETTKSQYTAQFKTAPPLATELKSQATKQRSRLPAKKSPVASPAKRGRGGA